MIDISQKTCTDCTRDPNTCTKRKDGWVKPLGALVPYWGCLNIDLITKNKEKDDGQKRTNH